MEKIKRAAAGLSASIATLMLAFAPTVSAATVPVYGDNLAGAGWETYTTEFGTVSFDADPNAPSGSGVAKLTTIDDVESRARLFTNNFSRTKLNNVTELAYSSKVEEASCECGSVSMYVRIDLDGNLATTGDTTALVFEPYWQNSESPDVDPVTRGEWQTWDVDQGIFWSSNTTGPFVAGSGGPPFYTLADAKANAPDAVVKDLGVYIGSYNPSYITYADKVIFNSTTYDFEVNQPPMPTKKDDCKKGSWESYGEFKNQGECVSYVAKQQRTTGNLR